MRKEALIPAKEATKCSDEMIDNLVDKVVENVNIIIVTAVMNDEKQAMIPYLREYNWLKPMLILAGYKVEGKIISWSHIN